MTVVPSTDTLAYPGGLVELGYSQITAGVTVSGTTFAGATSIVGPLTVVCDGGPVLVEFYSPRTDLSAHATNNVLALSLDVDGTETGKLAEFVEWIASTTATDAPVYAARRITPSAGSRQFTVKGYRTNANCTVFAGDGTGGNQNPAFLRVSRILQATDVLVPSLNPPLVTQLPSNPSNGDVVDYLADATNGVVWRLRYWSGMSGSYKWMFVGGPPLWAVVDTEQSTTSTSYTDLATVGPTITLPLAGDYMIGAEASAYNNTNGGWALASYSLSAGGVAASDTWSVPHLEAGTTNSNREMGSRVYRHTGLTAGAVTMKYRVVAASTAFFSNRTLRATPIRVG